MRRITLFKKKKKKRNQKSFCIPFLLDVIVTSFFNIDGACAELHSLKEKKKKSKVVLRSVYFCLKLSLLTGLTRY